MTEETAETHLRRIVEEFDRHFSSMSYLLGGALINARSFLNRYEPSPTEAVEACRAFNDTPSNEALLTRIQAALRAAAKVREAKP